MDYCVSGVIGIGIGIDVGVAKISCISRNHRFVLIIL